MTDYAYVQGQSEGEQFAKAAFRRRTNTHPIEGHNVSNIHKLIDFLQNDKTDKRITRPIGNIIIGAHANAEALTNLMLFPNQAKNHWTDYETFQEAGTTPGPKSITIPDTLLGQTSTDPPSHFVHIKGCNLGRPGNEPLMSLLKAAFGNRVFVTAPKFFNEFVQHFAPRKAGGVFEYMALEFQVSSPEKLGGRDAILAEFQNNHTFNFFDGRVVQPSDLATWIVKNPSAGPKAIPGIKKETRYPAKLGMTVGGRDTVPVKRELRVEQTALWPWSLTPFSSPALVPGDYQLRKNALKADLPKADARFRSNHPFPYYLRERFADPDKFVEGHFWHFTQKGNVLSATGSRWLYTLVIPIETASGNLVFNFYPDIGSSLQQIINIEDTNPTNLSFYTRV